MTRLTHSGLSITEWQPIVGTIPPLDQAQWQDAFRKYQATPEYQQVNKGMALAHLTVVPTGRALLRRRGYGRRLIAAQGPTPTMSRVGVAP